MNIQYPGTRQAECFMVSELVNDKHSQLNPTCLKARFSPQNHETISRCDQRITTFRERVFVCLAVDMQWADKQISAIRHFARYDWYEAHLEF